MGWLPPDTDLRPYAGLWVAVVDGRVVGVGRSARAAHLAAKRSRPKDDPVVLRISQHGQVVGRWRSNHGQAIE